MSRPTIASTSGTPTALAISWSTPCPARRSERATRPRATSRTPAASTPASAHPCHGHFGGLISDCLPLTPPTPLAYRPYMNEPPSRDGRAVLLALRAG